jgi:hypothetical protein
VTRQQIERLGQALRTIGDGFHMAASTLLEVKGSLGSGGGDTGPTPDEAFIDQRTALVPRELYLSLAREHAFPCRKIGKRVVAQWGDVRAALAGQVGSTSPTDVCDRGNDALRRSIGIQPKEGS